MLLNKVKKKCSAFSIKNETSHSWQLQYQEMMYLMGFETSNLDLQLNVCPSIRSSKFIAYVTHWFLHQ